MLKRSYFNNGIIEAGCDEAGRGCLAGPVFAAAVVLPSDYTNADLDDSKKLTRLKRDKLRVEIEKEALQWHVAQVSPEVIDRINILTASFLAMHLAIAHLEPLPALLLIDGNRFKAYAGIDHKCIIKGDGIYMSIAAASVLAKTHRDEFMKKICAEYPQYGWDTNMGYPTSTHRQAVIAHGFSPWHRQTFKINGQYRMDLE